MKEKLIKLFFEKEEIFFLDNEPVDRIEYEFIEKTDEINSICKILKYSVLTFIVLLIYQIVLEIIYPTGTFGYVDIYNNIFKLIIIIYINYLIDYFYINEMCKISVKTINKKLINKTKNAFLSIIISITLGIHNICYSTINIVLLEQNIHYLFILIIFAIIISSFILGIKLINNLFKQIETLKNETDGII